MRHIIVLVSLLSLIACGSSGGGGGSDLSCAPSNPSAPTVDLNTNAQVGQWTLELTKTSSTCPNPPSTITCLLDMSVSGNDVAISGSCTSNAGVTINLDNTSGIQSAATLYWGATMSGSYGTYTETDTVSCKAVAFESNTLSETFEVTASVAWSDEGESGTCSTTFSGVFR